MIKGISDIIAMMIMVVITVSIIGFGYTFVSGVFTSRSTTVFFNYLCKLWKRNDKE
jgi:FlaG/FlaF family flagellin (archaellin)